MPRQQPLTEARSNLPAAAAAAAIFGAHWGLGPEKQRRRDLRGAGPDGRGLGGQGGAWVAALARDGAGSQDPESYVLAAFWAPSGCKRPNRWVPRPGFRLG